MMAEHVSQKPSDRGEQSYLQANTKQERRVDIERQIKVILQEINILKKILANVEARFIAICENYTMYHIHRIKCNHYQNYNWRLYLIKLLLQTWQVKYA